MFLAIDVGNPQTTIGLYDAEGAFRRHWLLVDSLEIYTELRAWRYLGPKKALRQLREKDRASFQLYEAALTRDDPDDLAAWVAEIRKRYDKRKT